MIMPVQKSLPQEDRSQICSPFGQNSPFGGGCQTVKKLSRQDNVIASQWAHWLSNPFVRIKERITT